MNQGYKMEPNRLDEKLIQKVSFFLRFFKNFLKSFSGRRIINFIFDFFLFSAYHKNDRKEILG